VTSVTDSINKLTGAYGGSDKTSGSFLRPEHVKYNSITKAKDLGKVVNLSTTLTGNVGTEVGANTLYFKVTTLGDSDLLLKKNSIHQYKDQYVTVGLLDSDRKPVQRTVAGFGYINEILNTIPKEAQFQLPKGTYYFTVSNSQWQKMPFSIGFQVIRYILIDGFVEGALTATARIALVKMWGEVIGSALPYATVTPKHVIKALEGQADGQALPTLEIAILRGTATLTNASYGRLKGTWRISGTISGESANTATLNVTTPGGGYGP
tara:strand:- start:54 stop:848 length:795 start_codon:yes stop_codon:yes gene_type:complete